MTKITLPGLVVDTSTPAPISATVRAQLIRDVQNMQRCAKRKGMTLNQMEQREEQATAREHFELGCWLYHYTKAFHKNNGGSVEMRAACVLRIFLAGISNPAYQFHTIFEFGERQFDSMFEQGDGNALRDLVLQAESQDPTGGLTKIFQQYGWVQATAET